MSNRLLATIAALILACATVSPTTAKPNTAVTDGEPSVVIWDDPVLEALYSPEIKEVLATKRTGTPPSEVLYASDVDVPRPAAVTLGIDDGASLCVNYDGDRIFQGNTYGDGAGATNAEIFGVRAVIDVNGNDHDYCDPGQQNIAIDDGFVYSWVAFTKGPDNTGFTANPAIIQVGSQICSDQQNIERDHDECDGRQHHMSWAAGGCSGAQPYARYLGDTDDGPHQYWISTEVRTGSHTVNGQTVHSGNHLDIMLGHSDANRINNAWDVLLWSGDAGLNCWVPDTTSEGNGNRSMEAQVYSERSDSGDTNGNCNSCSPWEGHTYFSSNRYQTSPQLPNGTWVVKEFPTSPSPGGCTWGGGGSDNGCDVANADPDTFSVWDSD